MPEAAHPGVILAAELKKRGMTHAMFAKRMGVSRKHVSEIMNGRTGFSPEFALGMERVLGGKPPAEFWLRALSDYRTGQLRQQQRAE